MSSESRERMKQSLTFTEQSQDQDHQEGFKGLLLIYSSEEAKVSLRKLKNTVHQYFRGDIVSKKDNTCHPVASYGLTNAVVS